jgi:putative drug exporter of the RND superfamily
MFDAIGRLVLRRPRRILALAGLALVLAAVFGVRAPARLQTGGFTSTSAPSQIASDRLQSAFGGRPNLILLVRARSGSVDDPAVAAAAGRLTGALSATAGVDRVTSYWQTHASALRSTDGSAGLVVAEIEGNDTTVQTRAHSLIAALAVGPGRPGPVTVLAGGVAGVSDAITTQIGKDLALAEGLAIPITAILLIVAFGSAVAALLPVAIGMTSIVATLFVLWALTGVTDVSIYAINLTTALGLGLGIDYSLLMVSRYREELAGGRTPEAALQASVASAGRTIVYSAATVAAALGALLVFPVYFLRSFAYAGISVVAISTVSALLVLPALLGLLGHRVNALAVPWLRHRTRSAESPFWRGVARRVMARPLLAGLPVIAVLLLAGTPFLHVHFGTPDDRALPTSAAARQVGDQLRSSFATNTANTLDVITSRPLAAGDAVAYSRSLASVPGVVDVTGPAGTWASGTQVSSPSPADARYQSAAATWFTADIRPDPLSGAAATLVHQVRALPTPAGISAYVGGQAAGLVDQKHDLGSRLPLAIGMIVLTTFVLLFLFTGSVVLPLKALALNALSLTAVFGAVVWVFQDGHLLNLLGSTPTPTSTTMPLLLFCIAFGLSMDYEVFLLSRIKELHDRGADDHEAITGGVARTGRIVTTAAALLAVTFIAFGLSKVSFIQLFGLGTALAILVDATLVRGVLVPAFMRLAGRANWWAPRSLRRLHARVALVETEAPREPVSV